MSVLENLKAEAYLPYVVGGGLVAAGVTFAYFKLKKEDHLVDAPNDVVVLRQIPRGPYAPSMSPYPMKLETYLRLAKIPYKNVISWKMSPLTQRTPWAQLNGEILTDSQLIIDHVNKYFKKDTMSHLTQKERAVARFIMKMMEECTIMPFARWRWELDPEDFAPKALGFSWLTTKMLKRQIKKAFWNFGVGRLPFEVNLQMFRTDLQALSTYLGDKKFLMGEKPCEVDCSVFGVLAQFIWNCNVGPITKVMDEFPNLRAYCERIKETFWPDWDDCITHGGTKEATK